MQLITKRPGLNLNCVRCNSAVILEKDDVQDKLVYFEFSTHPGLQSTQFWFWSCPVCRHDNAVTRHTLPMEWPAYQPIPQYAAMPA
jgi:hypothetical protein